jgi:hypothetical protein
VELVELVEVEGRGALLVDMPAIVWRAWDFVWWRTKDFLLKQ